MSSKLSSRMSCALKTIVLLSTCAFITLSTPGYAKRVSLHIDPRLEVFEENITEIPNEECRIFSRSIDHDTNSGAISPISPLVIAINGIPASSWIYRDLAIKLYKQGWDLQLVDLPGTARSKMKKKTIWINQRSCIKEFLLNQKRPLLLVLHDIAGPIILPFLNEIPNLKGLLVMNTILKTKNFKPVGPMKTIKTHIIGDLAAFFMGLSKYRKEMNKMGLEKPVDDIWIQQIYSDLKAEKSKGHLSTILRGFENSLELDEQIERNIKNFKGPKIALWGLADPSLGGQSIQAEAYFGSSHFYALTQAKHFLMLDHPLEIAKAFSENFDSLKVFEKSSEPKHKLSR